MDILSNYRISAHWANDRDALQVAAERARMAAEREAKSDEVDEPRRHGLFAGSILHRTRNA